MQPVRRLWCTLWLVLGVTLAHAGDRPVAIVAAGNAAGGDRSFFQYYVTAPLGVVSVDCGTWLDPAEFANYAMVVWLRGAPDERRWSPDDLETVRAYLENGGHLLLTNGAILGLLGRSLKSIPWLAAESWAYDRHLWPATLVTPDHPWLDGLTIRDQPWLAGPHALTGFTGVNVLGKAGQWTTLGYASVGRGRAIFSTYGPYDCRDDRTKQEVMAIYRHMVAAADPLTEAGEAAALLAQAAPGRRLVAWRRDWTGSTERRLLWRPFGPRSADLLDTLEFVTAAGEIDTAFFCVQSAAGVNEVQLEVEPLKRADSGLTAAGCMTVLVMGQAPEVDVQPPASYGVVDRSRRGPFYLVPPALLPPLGRDAFALDGAQPAVIWVQVDARLLASGSYAGHLVFRDAGGGELASLPVRARVSAVRMPTPRLVQLRTWGGGIGNDPRLVREMQRQGCDAGVLSYPNQTAVRLRGTPVSLLAALRAPGTHLRGQSPPPRLDFTAAWGTGLDRYLDHGLTFLMLKDARTGVQWANAITGVTCDVTTPFEEWPPAWRDAFVDFYAQVAEYLTDRGYPTAYPHWTDEPSWSGIVQSYLPRARAFFAAGLLPGSNWTTSGWMSPEQINTFATCTGDYGMYQYGYPNLQRFIAEGSVALPSFSQVGFTRGGTGLAVRTPHVDSRLQGWWVVAQGPPAHFVRTGPIWKDWLYYVDFTAMQWFRLGGVQGERLVAYGSSDHRNLSVDMLTSSDWEGARDGVDDANLARMVDWYLPRLKARATGDWRDRLSRIEAERLLWFTADSPFPVGLEPHTHRRQPENEPLLDYAYSVATADSTASLEAAKRYLLALLEEMAPHADRADVQVDWHDWSLVRDGRPAASVVVAAAAGEPVRAAAARIVDRIERMTGVRLPLVSADRLDGLDGVRLLVGQADDAPVAALLNSAGIQLDAAYPGPGGSRIGRLPGQNLIAILGVDEPGVERAVSDWLAFVRPAGHWLLPDEHRAPQP